jgi:hypothetical protein
MEENGESFNTLWIATIEETKLERREKKGEIRWPGARRINMATEVKSGVKSGFLAAIVPRCSIVL